MGPVSVTEQWVSGLLPGRSRFWWVRSDLDAPLSLHASRTGIGSDGGWAFKIGKATNESMRAVKVDSNEPKGTLRRTCIKIDNLILASLMENFPQIAVDAPGDKFGQI